MRPVLSQFIEEGIITQEHFTSLSDMKNLTSLELVTFSKSLARNESDDYSEYGQSLRFNLEDLPIEIRQNLKTLKLVTSVVL